MTKLLDQAVANVRFPPSERQDEVAEVRLSILEQEPETLQLSQEQLQEVARRLGDPDLTYASDEDAAALYRKLGA